MREMYILIENEAEAILKEALDGKYSLYRRISAVYRTGNADSEALEQIADSVLQDIVGVVGRPRTRKEDDIPMTEEYPELVYNEIVRCTGPVEVSADGSSITLRNKVWRIAFRHGRLYSLEWGDGESPHNHVWNILSYGWSNYYKGEWRECMNPSRAAELFLMLDDMAGYLDEEIPRIYQKVKRDSLCRHVRRVTKESLSNKDDAESKA